MSEPQDWWVRTENIFHDACAVAEPERTHMLQERCAGDTELMAELRSLLEACAAEELHSARSLGEPHQHRIGPYAIDRLLGSGGMGAVYLAHRDDGQFEQQVAVKVIDMPLATELFRERFRTERQILANLSHPYIARLLDGGVTEDGELYLALEYVEGASIQRFCDGHSLSTDQRLTLFRRVCEAVQYAHQNLIVHRDLKPDNILVKGDGTPRLLDFGTAKILSPPLEDAGNDATRRGMQAFTPRFASPEQVLGQPITTASDTYSLGVLLHLLLTGSYPYDLQQFSTEEMVRVICEQSPHRPSLAKPGIDRDLDSIVLKALRKEPAERYSTVEQFSADVQAYLEQRPVEARRGNVRYVTAKFMRRNKLALAAACLLLVTLSAGVGGVLWQSRVANLERRKAEARSADLRELSNSLLSEIDEALKDIPGSTGAQKLLVTRVLEHLDRMARDSQGDRQTDLDLIGAYTRLGNVQGNIYYQNVADTPGALASFNKALALAASLAQSNPRDAEVLRAQAAALEARGEMLSNGGDPEASASSLQAAVNVYERVIHLPGVTPALIFEAAIATETLGNELCEDSGLADAAAGIAAYRKALDMDGLALHLDPQYMAVRRGLPVMHLHIGNVMLDTNPAEALAEFETALQLQAELPDEQKQKLPQVRLHAQLLRKKAAAYVELGHYAKALPFFAQAAPIYQKLADSDPQNTAALADVTRILKDEATSYEYAANPLLAEVPTEQSKDLQKEVNLLEQLAATLQQIIKQAPSQETWASELASVTVRLGAARQALGLPLGSPTETAEALSLLRRFAEGPHAAANDVSLAATAYLTVEPPSLRDPSLTARLAERGVAMTRQRAAGYLLLLSQAYHANGQAAEASAAAQKGLRLLPTARPGEPKPRLRRLLEAEAHPLDAGTSAQSKVYVAASHKLFVDGSCYPEPGPGQALLSSVEVNSI